MGLLSITCNICNVCLCFFADNFQVRVAESKIIPRTVPWWVIPNAFSNLGSSSARGTRNSLQIVRNVSVNNSVYCAELGDKQMVSSNWRKTHRLGMFANVRAMSTTIHQIIELGWCSFVAKNSLRSWKNLPNHLMP